MRDRELYATILGLRDPWHVVEVYLDAKSEQVRVREQCVQVRIQAQRRIETLHGDDGSRARGLGVDGACLVACCELSDSLVNRLSRVNGRVASGTSSVLELGAGAEGYTYLNISQLSRRPR